MNQKMKLGGLAIDKDSAIWTQSYVDAEDIPEVPQALDIGR